MAMGSRVSVQFDTAAMRNAASALQGKAGDYQNLFKNLFAEVEGMKKSWDGADNMAFTKQIEEFRNDFVNMYDQINAYAECLIHSANQYEQKQHDLENRAKSLSTGK